MASSPPIRAPAHSLSEARARNSFIEPGLAEPSMRMRSAVLSIAAARASYCSSKKAWSVWKRCSGQLAQRMAAMLCEGPSMSSPYRPVSTINLVWRFMASSMHSEPARMPQEEPVSSFLSETDGCPGSLAALGVVTMPCALAVARIHTMCFAATLD